MISPLRTYFKRCAGLLAGKYLYLKGLNTLAEQIGIVLRDRRMKEGVMNRTSRASFEPPGSAFPAIAAALRQQMITAVDFKLEARAPVSEGPYAMELVAAAVKAALRELATFGPPVRPTNGSLGSNSALGGNLICGISIKAQSGGRAVVQLDLSRRNPLSY